jgi:hypothetical protein
MRLLAVIIEPQSIAHFPVTVVPESFFATLRR